MSSIQFQKNPMEKVAEKIAKKIAKIVAIVFASMFAIVIFVLIFGFLFKFLWNATIAAMFGLPVITYWQAIGLFILAKFLFGFGFGGAHSHHHHHGRDKRHEHWKGWWEHKPEKDSEQEDDEMLQKYWEEEGRQAYDAYIESRKSERQDGPEEQGV